MKKITNWLEKSSRISFALYCLFFSFSTYFCVYAFRKPFSVATFKGAFELPLGLGDIDYKVLLIISQVFGYALSKFIGIKFVSEVTKNNRALSIVALIAFAEAALILFPLVPAPYNAFCLFMNGIPLGMVWGLVFSYLEGRKTSDFLSAGLSASFIIGSGAVKSAGKYLMDLGVPEFWMPAVTGAVFLPMTLFCVKMLDLIPPPTKEEEETCTKRVPMDAAERKRFLKTFAPGIFLLTTLYVVISSFRDFRDNFAREIWDGMGYTGDISVFAVNEIPIAIVVIIALGTVGLFKDKLSSFRMIYAMMFTGSILIGTSTYAYSAGTISGELWMLCLGIGCYLAYVPFGSMFYDNLIGMTHFVGTAGLMIYVSDAFGYLGSVAVMLYKNFGHADLNWLQFFIKFSYFTSFISTICFGLSYFYFTAHAALRREVYGINN